MNYLSLGLAALAGTVASFAFGFLVFWLAPDLIKEGHKYPAVFRPKEEMTTVMPIGVAATFLSILVAAKGECLNVQNRNRHGTNDRVAVGPQVSAVGVATGNQQIGLGLCRSMAQPYW